MCQDSSIQHVWVWGYASMTEALDRSTLWLQEMCSAIAEAATSPFFRARRCSCNRWSKDLPVCPMYAWGHSAQGKL